MNLFNTEPPTEELPLDNPDWRIHSNILDSDLRLNPITFEVNRAFALCDTDKNNNLDKEEMRHFLKKFCPKSLKINDADSDCFFDSIDINNDGMVSKKEMIDYVMKLMDADQAHRPKYKFGTFVDENGLCKTEDG